MKKIGMICCLLGLLVCFGGTAFAAETEEDYIGEQLEQSGISSLFSLLPEEGSQYFFKNGYDSHTVDQLSLEGIVHWIQTVIQDQISAPLRLLLTLIGVLLLSALCSSLGDGFSNKEQQGIFALVSALAICGALAATVTDRILAIGEMVDKFSAFMLSFIPIFAGAAATAGKPVSAIGYQSVVFGAAQIFSQLFSGVLVPLLGILLAICLTGAVTDAIRVDAIANALKRTVLWLLSFALTIFVGLLTLKGFAGSAADTVANRAAKFAVATFVPVVGSALSDAYASLSACMEIVKNTIGIFGILAIVVSFLPPLVELALLLGSIRLSCTVAEIFGQTRPAEVLKAVGTVVSTLFGIIVCYGMMMTVSITILLMLGTGG